MTIAEARQLVQKTFQNPFDKGQFVYFIKNLVNEIDEEKAFHARGYVHEKYRDRVKTYERIGTYTDPEDNKIDILIVYLQKESSIDRARTTLRNFVGDYLKERGEKEAGLIAFVSPNQKDWRFSLVKMEYKITETPSGRVKAKEEFTPAKRYSFLVGVEETSHTAQSRLVPILEDDAENPTLKSIEEAFNIEKVTKEFFEKYRDLYLRVKETLDEVLKKDKAIKADFASKNIDTVDFGKKLLGQIVFLYFLQKKGWFGVKRGEAWGSGSKNFLRELFDKKHGDYKNFFNDALEPLFYEALRNDRSHDDHYFSMFKCKIPFLNGGLFDPINNYDWKETDIILPNDLFSNSYKTKEGDIGKGILDIFDRYNFTVKEDEPLEKEVAVDPEMLGKVFENLLEVKDRKSKGTYYTPREIVHYMCQESLVNYLATELDKKVSRKDIETLIKYGETAIEHDATSVEKKSKDPKYKSSYYKLKLPKSIERHAKLIDEKLETIRICDPAVGSGAFPVGMMNEIIRTRNVLTSYLKIKKGRTIYDFKRHAIQNCLYGVDIDLGAVEICKLRFWLSLVVDEDDIKQIKPLPNLDYKVMQGNSLVELLSPELLMQTMDREKNNLIDQLKRAKDEFFNIALPSDKARIRGEIEKLIISIFEYDKKSGAKFLQEKIHGIESQGRLFDDKSSEREDVKKISEIEQEIKKLGNIKLPGPAEHFEWHLNFSDIFKEKGGFDIVIANPPYVNVEKIDSLIKKSIHKFKTAYQKYDLYVLFYEKSISLLKDRGSLIFISSNKFLSQGYGLLLRQYLLNFQIKTIINFNFNVFESAVVRTCIFHLVKEESKDNKIRIIDVNDKKDKNKFLEGDYNYIDQEVFEKTEENNFRINLTNEKIELLNKIKKDCLCVEDICSVNYGLRPSSEKIGKKKSYFIKDSNPEGKYKRYFEGKDMGYWRVKNTHFIDYKPNVMYNPMFIELFENEKLVGLRTLSDINKLRFIYDDEGLFCNDSVVILTPWYLFGDVNYITIKRKITKERIEISKKYSIKYLQAILNSKLIKFYVNELLYDGTHFYPDHMKSLPIKPSGAQGQKPFTNLVDKILSITKDNDYLQNPAKQAKVGDYEKQIDQLVHNLYGLTPEEIKIVESQ